MTPGEALSAGRMVRSCFDVDMCCDAVNTEGWYGVALRWIRCAVMPLIQKDGTELL